MQMQMRCARYERIGLSAGAGVAVIRTVLKRYSEVRPLPPAQQEMRRRRSQTSLAIFLACPSHRNGLCSSVPLVCACRQQQLPAHLPQMRHGRARELPEQCKRKEQGYPEKENGRLNRSLLPLLLLHPAAGIRQCRCRRHRLYLWSDAETTVKSV